MNEGAWRLERVLLEAGHRLGTVGLLVVAAGAVLLWREERGFWYVLPVGFLVADLGLVCGFGAWVRLRRGSPASPSCGSGHAGAWGVMMFNAGLMGVAGMLMMIGWLHW